MVGVTRLPSPLLLLPLLRHTLEAPAGSTFEYPRFHLHRRIIIVVL